MRGCATHTHKSRSEDRGRAPPALKLIRYHAYSTVGMRSLRNEWHAVRALRRSTALRILPMRDRPEAGKRVRWRVTADHSVDSR